MDDLERFRKLIEDTKAGYFRIDMEGRFQEVNDAWLRMHGYSSPDEIIGKHLSVTQVEADMDKAQKNFERLISGKSIPAGEFSRCYKDGSIGYHTFSAHPIIDSAGEVVGLEGFLIDITERKKAEDKILKLNRVYAVISQINQTIVKLREKDKLLNEACRIAVEYGQFQMAWIGIVDEETNLIKPVAYSGFEDGYLSKIKRISIDDVPEGRGPTGTAIRENRHYVCDDIEKDPRMKLWSEEALKRGYRSSIGLPIKHFGKVIGAFTLYASIPHFFDPEEIHLLDEVTNDISFAIDSIEIEKKRQEAEEALRKNEARLKVALSPIDMTVFNQDLGLRYTWMYRPQLGYTTEQVIGKTDAELLPPEAARQVTEIKRSALENGTGARGEVEVALEDRIIYYDLIVEPLCNTAGQVVGITGASLDITERKRVEKELKQIEWLLKSKVFSKETFAPNYGDITKYNTDRTILNALGTETIKNFADYFMGLLETSSAVYERNGDYAAGIFSSGWCQFLDNASFKLCNTDNIKEALNCGKWSCHESCWSEISKKAIENNIPTDIECAGGIHIYAVPISLDNEIIGAINIGYGDTPKNPEKLNEIAAKFQVDIKELTKLANEYETRPQFIIDFAKYRLVEAANLMGLLVERKLAEEALRGSEEKYRRIVETTHEGIWMLDASAKTSYVNPRMAQMLGYTAEEMLGRHLFDFMDADARIEAEKKLEKRKQGIIETHDFRFSRKDRTDLWTIVSTNPILDDKGQYAGTLGMMTDISERKQAEEALKKSEEFTKNILETVDEGFIVIDKDYRITSANRAYCEQVKAPDCDIIGRHCYEVSHHLEKPCFMADEECAPRHTFKTGVPHTALHTHYDKEGNTVYVETKSFPIKDSSGKVFAVIETQNNITERRKLEEQLRHAQKMEAIGTLAGGIAHDFNNMLNVIIGYGGMMQMHMKPDDPQMDQLKEILAAGDRAAQLTKGLLTFSRKQVMEIKTVNLNEIIEGFKKMLARIIGEDIDLKITLSDKDLTVKVDIVQIEQVLMNLVVNARDAMPKGGALTIETLSVKIDREFIKTHGYGEPGKYALITVSDTGTGMDEKTRERIFEPYFTTKEMGKGTGLGLAIVYGIVTQHNGYLHCYSEAGKGTTFRIYIPLVKSAAEIIEKEEAIVPKGGTETILVAEDDASVRGLIKNILEGFGYTVIEAVDGNDAVGKFKDNKDKIQLLLSDLIMPGKNGKDAYEDIKGIRHDIRVIFISGYARDIIQRFGIEEGIEFISKPVLPGELLRKVREELDR